MRDSDISAWAPFHGGQRTHSARLNEAAHDSSAVIIATGVPGLKLEPRGRGPFGAAAGPGVSPPVLGAPRAERCRWHRALPRHPLPVGRLWDFHLQPAFRPLSDSNFTDPV